MGSGGEERAPLVDAAGLKGLRIGDAEVSTQHGNFILNHGQATASELRRLIETVRDAVHEAHGVLLVPEVQFVGDWSEWST